MLEQLFARRTMRRGLAANRRHRAAARYRMLGETLERRSMLAVSASVSAGTLNIALGADGDAAFLSYAGSAYTLTNGAGTAVSGSPFTNVTANVFVSGAAGNNQSFTFNGSTALPVSLVVAADVEAATISTAIAASGLANSAVSVSSPTITLAADISTAGAQTYAGAVQLAGSPSLTSTGGAINFSSTVDAVGVGFAAPATFAAGMRASSVATGDVNGDGKPDLAIVNLADKTVSVFLNTTVPGATAPSYAAQVTFATGTFPTAVAIGDLNGDGKPDIVIANKTDSTVSVLANTTTPGATAPTFVAQATFTTGTGSKPMSVAIGDVNGDGKPDLATSNYNSGTNGTVGVLLNTRATGVTTPSFAAPTTFTTGSVSQAVAIADMNGDGLPDLTVVNAGSISNSVSVLLNNASAGATVPSFRAQATFAAGTTPYAVAIGDLNGDGRPDLAIANNLNSGTVSVLLNTTVAGATTPTYASRASFAVGSGPRSVAIADMNGDGKPDLAITNRDSNSASVLLSTMAPGASTPAYAGQATFAAGTTLMGVVIADMNGDGKPDLAISNYGDGSKVAGSASVLLNTTFFAPPALTLSPQATFATGSTPKSVALGDFNGDGKPDLAIANYDTGLVAGSVSVLLNTTLPGATAPTYAAQATFAARNASRSIAVGDLNGDGRPDLVVANGTGAGTVSVFWNTTSPGATSPSFAAQATFAAGSIATSVSIGDFNGDGRPDLALSNYNGGSNGNGTVSVLLNTASAGATAPSYSSPSTFLTGTKSYSVAIGDLNGDGKPDLAVANRGSNTVSVLVNQTSTGATVPSFVAQSTFSTGTASEPTSVRIGDINGDGKPDLAVANRSAGTVSVLFNNAATGTTTPTFATAVAFAAGASPYSVTIGDLNGDGKPDLVVPNSGSQSNSVSVLLNTTAPGATSPSYAAQSTFAVGTAPASAAIGDMNGDGKPDLVVANAVTSGSVSVLMNATPSGTLTISSKNGTTLAAAVGGTRPLASLAIVAGTTSLGGNVTTTGTQSYAGAVTIAANATLTGTTVTTASTIAGGTNVLAIVGNAVVGGAVTGLTSYSVSGTTKLGGSVTTTGAQTYVGAVTLTADATLTGTTPTFTAGVAGGGNSLTLNFSGTTAIDGTTFTGINNLTTGNGGATTLAGAITTTGTQTYNDAVLLAGDTTLAGTTITTASTVAGAAKALAITGNAVVGGAITGLTSYSVSGTTSLGANVTTTGTQTYSGAVTLAADTALAGTTITTGSTVAGAAKALAITGNAVVNGAITGLTSYAVSGTTSLGADVTTTNAQTYTGQVTLAATTILTGTNRTFTTGVNGGGYGLALFDGTATIEGAKFTNIDRLTVFGTLATLSGTIRTTGTGGQTYQSPVVLAGDTTLEGRFIQFSEGCSSSTPMDLTITGSAGTSGAISGVKNLSVSGTSLLGGSVTTTGTQTYTGAVTLAADTVLSGTNPTFGGTVTGGGKNLTLNFIGLTAIDGTTFTGINSLATGNGGTTTLQGTITTTGTQTYNDAVTLNADTTVSTGSGNISFTATVNGAVTLTANSTGATTFGGTVGGTTALTSLTTDAGGTVSLQSVTTSGSQSYGEAVTLAADATLSAGSGAIGFGSTVDGDKNLTVNTSGTTTFGGVVGGTTRLTSLNTNAGGTTSLGGVVQTTGAQYYLDSVTLAADTTLSALGLNSITFVGTVNGDKNLIVNTAGITQFNGGFGDTTPLRSVTTDAGNKTIIRGAATTTGVQTYNEVVYLASDTTLTGTVPTFASGVFGGSAVAGYKNLTLNFSSTTAIDGATFTGIKNLTTGNGGTTQLRGTITTSGTQTYNDAVTLAADTVLTGTTPTFTAGVVGNDKNLTLNFSGTTAIDGAKFTGIKGLAAGNGGTTTLAGTITTTGTQTYNDAVTLAAGTTLTGTTLSLGSGVNQAGSTLTVVFETISLNAAAGQTVTYAAPLVGTSKYVKTGGGTLAITAASALTGETTVQQGTLRLANAAALASSKVIPVAGGTASLAPYLQTTVGGLAPNAGGLVDLGNGLVTVAIGLSPADLVTAIVAGRADGSWTGTSGITSSAAAADLASGTPRAVGWLDNGDGSVTTAFAAPGDTNLDWRVDILDAGNFLTLGKYDTGLPATWLEGDFNYDRVVDIQDAADFFGTVLYDTDNYNMPASQAASATGMAADDTGVLSPLQAAFASFAAAASAENPPRRKNRTAIL